MDFRRDVHDARQIGWHLRGMQPWPMPYTFLHVAGRPPARLLILDIDEVPGPIAAEALPGTVLKNEGGEVVVRTGDGAAAIRRIQAAGKRALSIDEYLRGNAIPAGSRFGGETPAG